MIKLYLDKEYELDCKEKINYFDILYRSGDNTQEIDFNTLYSSGETHLRAVPTADGIPEVNIVVLHDNYPYMKKIAENATTTFYKFINWENSVSS